MNARCSPWMRVIMSTTVTIPITIPSVVRLARRRLASKLSIAIPNSSRSKLQRPETSVRSRSQRADWLAIVAFGVAAGMALVVPATARAPHRLVVDLHLVAVGELAGEDTIVPGHHLVAFLDFAL